MMGSSPQPLRPKMRTRNYRAASMEGRLLSLVQTSLGAASKSEGLQASDVESLHVSEVFVVRSTKILSFIQDIISSTSGTRQSPSRR